MKFLLYEGRHGERTLMNHDPKSWDYLRQQQDNDNNASLEDIVRDLDPYALSGDPDYSDNAEFSIDDGGSITTIELTEIQ